MGRSDIENPEQLVEHLHTLLEANWSLRETMQVNSDQWPRIEKVILRGDELVVVTGNNKLYRIKVEEM